MHIEKWWLRGLIGWSSILHVRFSTSRVVHKEFLYEETWWPMMPPSHLRMHYAWPSTPSIKHPHNDEVELAADELYASAQPIYIDPRSQEWSKKAREEMERWRVSWFVAFRSWRRRLSHLVISLLLHLSHFFPRSLAPLYSFISSPLVYITGSTNKKEKERKPRTLEIDQEP